MNRRLRAGELGLAEVERSLAPYRPHVETSPGAAAHPPADVPGDGLDIQRAQAVDALHTYIVAAVGYDHGRALLILNRVLTTLSLQLDPVGRADHRH